MLEKFKNRESFIILVLVLIFSAFIFRLYNLNVINGEKYREKSLKNRIKRVTTFAKRGEITDRNGKLLAGNKPGFYVKFMDNNLSDEEINTVGIKLFTILDDYNQKHIEFPIRVADGKFRYKYDLEKERWLEENGFNFKTSAKDVFESYRKKYLVSESLDKYEAQELLLLQGVKLPIYVKYMKYSYDFKKEQFLSFYGIDKGTSAEEAFEIIRNKSYYAIGKNYTDEEAYKILSLKHAINEKGYKQYEPIIVTENISQQLAAKIFEVNLDLPGVSVETKPIRQYPYKNLASHIIGYMSYISFENEIQKYVVENNYDKNQLIGKTGIERKYELELSGENGYKYIEIDALGEYIRDIDVDKYDGLVEKEATSGNDLRLTIDIDLQEKLERYLQRAIDALQVGGTFESKWGDFEYKETFDEAKMAAGVVVDVKNGDVLALASIPDYDLNLFATGITNEDWNSLQPENKNNPLAPIPLYNIATRTAVQPGSTYKMITGYAALEEGLDPKKKLYSDGYVEIGNHQYGCWYWNTYRAKHGLTDLYDAIATSCNYYFFDIANGYDYYREEPLTFELGSDKLIETSKDFGLDDSSGIEISEVVTGVPDPQKKSKVIKVYLRRKLELILKDYFPADIVENEDKLGDLIDTIVAFGDENPTRGEIIRKLKAIGAVDDYYKISELADIIKYDYFNFMKWNEGDTLNFAIGQGGHQYTPVQMARYIASIANGGEVLDLNLILDSEKKVVNTLNPGYIKELQKGMYGVTNGDNGTATYIFRDFPMEIAGKTGTAEKEGKIPSADEIKYLTGNLNKIDPTLDIETVERKTLSILKERNHKIAELESKVNSLEKKEQVDSVKEEISETEKKIRNLISSGYLEKKYAMRSAIKKLSSKDLTDEMINQYRKKYSDYAWFVSYAPFDDPEIAVVILIPQGGHGGYAAPVAKEIIGEYFNLPPTSEADDK